MTDSQTTLAEFVDNTDAATGDVAGPTPAENAAAISSLADVLEEQVGQISEIVDRLDQQETADSIDTEPRDGGRMYQ